MTATQVLEQQERQSMIDAAVQRAAKELADEMDFSILADLYKESGWTEIEFNPWWKEATAGAMKQWLEANCKGHRMSRGKRFLFQDKSDAINFVLKWGN